MFNHDSIDLHMLHKRSNGGAKASGQPKSSTYKLLWTLTVLHKLHDNNK